MRTRKTKADSIRALQNERDIRRQSVNNLLKKNAWTQSEMEVIEAHMKWLKNAEPVINEFYKPAQF